jgi:hypothetical protein
MELLAPFLDIEDVGLTLLASAGPTVLVTPTTITPPLIVVRRVGGGGDWITDAPRLQVRTFGATHVQGWNLAEACRQLIMASPATLVAGATIDRAITETAPAFVDYGQSLHRYVATYRLELRRPR